MVAQASGQGSLIGATIGGYEVVALIGRGAMGAVYLARDVKLNRLVALKVLLGSLAKSPALVKQFHQEAKASAPLNHPSIVRVYSAGLEHGTPYIAMEYVEGEPLDRFLKRKGTVDWEVALHIGIDVAQGLEVAHKAGIVHRDIKPSNIMLDKMGGTRLADFGIAKIQSEDSSSGGSFLGTPQYMSPEQANNDSIGPSSDLYSLGVTLYQMISGEMPFRGESSMALINSICNEDPVRLNMIVEGVPDDVARFVAYLLGKTPKQRPANAKVAYSMMQRLLKQRGASTSISEGLSGFIQSEMEIRAFHCLSEIKSDSDKKRGRGTIRGEGIDFKGAFGIAVRAAVVCVVAVVAFALPDLTLSQASVDTSVRVPDTQVLEYRRLADGIHVYQLDTEAYRFSCVAWIGDEAKVWLEVEGRDGSAAQGEVGALGVDVREQGSMTLVSPLNQERQPGLDPVYRASLRNAAVLPLASSHFLSMRYLVSGVEASSGDVVVVSRTFDSVYADPVVLMRSSREQWVWGEQNDRLRPRVGSAILNPDGTSICYLRVDPELDQTYLVEQSLEDETWLEFGEPLTSPGMEILPGSVQYTASGSHILYLRGRSAAGAELWRVASMGSEQDGQLVASGVLGSAYSINPKGDTVLVSLVDENLEGDVGQLALVQIHTKNVKRLGAGRVGRNAFHPTEPFVIVNQEPLVGDVDRLYRESKQLVAIDVRDTDRKIVLTDIRNGMRESYAVSRDGRYVTGIAEAASMPSLLVIEWGSVDLSLP